MKPRLARWLAGFFAAALCLPSYAQRSAKPDEGYFVVAGINAGLSETFASQGDNYRLGSSNTIGVGYEFANEGPWITRVSVGYRAKTSDVGTTENAFSYVPIDVMLLRGIGFAKVGVGVGYHMGPEYTATVGGAKSRLDLENQFAVMGEIEIRPIRFASFGVRYTYVTYGTQNTNFLFDDNSTADTLNGSSVGVYALVKF